MILKLKSDTDRESIKAYIDKLDLSTKKYTVEICLDRVKRSLSQNSLYWLWVACISNETGNSGNDVHDYLKTNFIPKKTVDIFNQHINKTITTTDLKTDEFTAFLDKIKVFAASELGLILPLPEDLHFNEFYAQYKHLIRL